MRYFGLIGKPLVHSFSQRYFTQKFQEESIDAAYGLYELDKIEDLKQLCSFLSLGGKLSYDEALEVLNELKNISDNQTIIANNSQNANPF